MLFPDLIDLKDEGDNITMKLNVPTGGAAVATSYDLTQPVALKLFTDLGKLLGKRLENANREKHSHKVEL